jgi:4-amino-4-deoxy-L-arabinose transferase-like glycosyltransferase
LTIDDWRLAIDDWRLATGNWQLILITLRNRFVLPSLLAFAILPYFVGLGASSIWDANEAFYAETPREMIERGDYISPTFNYEPRLNKPVLSYWIVAAFYKLFGVSEGVERLPIAIGAIVIIGTAFFLACAGMPQHGSAGRTHALQAGLWAALGLAIAPRLLMFSRRIFIDIYISMFMGLTLLFFALAERYPDRRRTFLVLMYACVGLGVLTKGPIAALLPGLVFAAYLLLHRELGRVRDMMIPLGAAIVAVLVVPYYAALYQRHGWAPITTFLMGENFDRFTEGVGVESSRGPYFYLPIVFSDAFPWAILLLGAAVLWFADRRAAHDPRPAVREYRVHTLLWLWILTIVGFFSLSEAKQDLYIFPIVPATGALAGILIARGLAEGSGLPARLLRGSTVAMGLLLALAGLAVLFIFRAAGTMYALEGAMFVGIVGAAGGVLAVVLAILNRTPASLLAIVGSLIVLNWAFVVTVLPNFERYKPVPGLSAAIADRASPDDAVVHYNVALPSMVYYLRRHVDQLFDAAPFLDHLRGPRTVYAVLSADDYERLRDEIGSTTCVIARRPDVNVKLKDVLARQPLPEVLLITNRCGDR